MSCRLFNGALASVVLYQFGKKNDKNKTKTSEVIVSRKFTEENMIMYLI